VSGRTKNDRRLAVQQPACGSKENAVTLFQPRTRDLAAKNRQLVSEHDDLQLLEPIPAQPQRRNRKRTSE